jgi:predicted Zn-dependent peptidase/outer membrane lipoprotein-sorting protein
MNPTLVRSSRRLRLAAALVALGIALPAAAQTHYKKLTYPPLRDLQLPKVERVELKNGLILYLVEDHLLPKVEGYAVVRTGERWVPAAKAGLGAVVAQAMRTGGTEKRKGEEIDRLLANVGATVETGMSRESATATLFALKSDLPLVLDILADLLRNPAFPEDKIELAKVQLRTGIARRNDDVGEIADREFNKLVYGADSPYVSQPEYETVQNISREDVVAFHHAAYYPDRTILGLWGDFDSRTVKALVEQRFGDWARSATPAPALPAAPTTGAGTIGFIQKDDVNQTNLRIGHLGGRLDDPDYYALNVMAEILGGGLSSRLFRRVRSDMGLAYAAFGAWSAEYDYPGTFFVRVDTKSETTVKAAQAVIEQLRLLTSEPVTAEELRVAKEGILNSFVFNFDTTGEIVRRLMTYEYFDYPRDFLDTFKANVEKVTAEDVLRVAKMHLRPDQLMILAVGRAQDFDQPLATLGAVKAIDIAIPQPKPAPAKAMPAATAESEVQGKKILQMAIRGTGGLDALRGIRDESILARVKQVTPQGEIPLTTKFIIVLPDKFRQDVVLPYGEVTLVYDGKGAWQKHPGGLQDLSASQVEELLQARARSWEVLLLDAADGKRQVQYLESAKVEDRDAEVIAVTDASGDVVRLFVDKETGHILRRVNRARSPFEGEVEEETTYSDFRSVAGLAVPFKAVTLQNGELAREQTVQSYEINVGVDPALFERPQVEKNENRN